MIIQKITLQKFTENIIQKKKLKNKKFIKNTGLQKFQIIFLKYVKVNSSSDLMLMIG